MNDLVQWLEPAESRLADGHLLKSLQACFTSLGHWRHRNVWTRQTNLVKNTEFSPHMSSNQDIMSYCLPLEFFYWEHQTDTVQKKTMFRGNACWVEQS